MPSRVASSLVASLNSHTHHLITYTIQEYEDVVVRICYSPSIRYRMKLSLASNLLIASTFNKLSMQTSLEYAYTQAWEVRNILKKASKSLIDEQDPYHVVLPHIIGQSSSHSTSLKKNIMTNEFYERGLQLIQWLSCYGKIIKYYSNDDNMKMKYMKVLQDLIKDSDAEAVVDIQSSIRSIRYRLLLGGIENYYQKKLIIHGWNELLYDSCVYSYNCSIICLSLSFPENDLLSKTVR